MVNCYDGKTFGSGACGGSTAVNSYGRLTGAGMTYSGGVVVYTNYSHDDEGRVASSTQGVEGAVRTFQYGYYADNSAASMQFPSATKHVTCYDEYGRPLWVSSQLQTTDCGTVAPTAANSYGWVASYSAHGGIEQLKFGMAGGYGEQWCYNNLLQVTGMRFGVGTTSGCGWQAGDPLGLRLEYTSGSQAQNNGNVMQQFIRMRKSAFDP